jgi:hypothetical protein
MYKVYAIKNDTRHCINEHKTYDLACEFVGCVKDCYSLSGYQLIVKKEEESK